ncbi:MAG: MTH1187 family thiamine-binding protein [Candidatus Thermoplasmatota archaeon]|nr:MTH1187 family thiamine-binding protein [Candidatus Thermoplasmatota archaeon]
MIIAQISIAPVGKDVDLSGYVKKAVTILQKETDRCEINAMATVVETKTIDQLFQAVGHAHNKVLGMPGVHRVITEIKIDDRRDKNATIEDKIKAVTI